MGSALLIILTINVNRSLNLARITSLITMGYKAKLSVCDIFIQTAEVSFNGVDSQSTYLVPNLSKNIISAGAGS
jgi:hypothetical protein